jgi:3-hydroxymyristoyl/3-hydroxydecanoyl-(acyl carrier protein) dehydratase
LSERIEARLTVPADHPSLPGHFPGQPVVPGVLLLERVIEAAEQAIGQPLHVLGMPQVKFLAPLLPGEEAVAVMEWQVPQREANYAQGAMAMQPQTIISTSQHELARPRETLRFRIERAGQTVAQGAFQIDRRSK